MNNSIDWYAIVDSVGNDADVEQFVTMPAASRLLLMELATSFYGRYNRSGLAEPTDMYKYLSIAQKALAREEQPMDRTAVGLGTAINILQTWPGIVGIWPGSYDATGNGRSLLHNGSVELDGIIPAVSFNGSSYMSYPDDAGLDASGSDMNYESPGVTIGLWVKITQAATAPPRGIVGKDRTGQLSYSIFQVPNSSKVGFRFSANGTIANSVASLENLQLGVWSFVVGRFIPSVESDIFSNMNKVVTVAQIPASLHVGTAPFEVGRILASYYFVGETSMIFLANSAIGTDRLNLFYETSRSIFDG